jgi:hypothetical protein
MESSPARRGQALNLAQGTFGHRCRRKGCNYHRRSIAENAMYRLKQLFGDSLASRIFETQKTEVHARVAAMNIMTYLGMPISVRVGAAMP